MGSGAVVAGAALLAGLFGAAYAIGHQSGPNAPNPCQPCAGTPPPNLAGQTPPQFPGSAIPAKAEAAPAVELVPAVPAKTFSGPAATPAQTANSQSKYR